MDDNEPIGLLIGAVRRRIRQALATHVRRYHLTTQQFWVLVAVAEHPGFSLGELAAHLRMDTPTASRVVFTLLNRKLVQVRGDATDRRRAHLHPEPSGESLGGELIQLATAVRAAAVRGLSAAELTALRLSLRKIISNMDRFQDNNSAASPRRNAAGPARRRARPQAGRAQHRTQMKPKRPAPAHFRT
jgi:MarR family multiple antibiotic resistance transcriptional regulator